MMKKEYLKPSIKVVKLRQSGIICTSQVQSLGGNSGFGLGGDDTEYTENGGFIR